DAINQIRQRSDVKMPIIVSPKSREELRIILRHERMVELAFEGQRFFDIRRYAIAEDVMNGPTYGMTYTDKNNNLVTLKDESFILYFEPKRDYLWPIPQKELDLNKNLAKNPGW